MADPMGQALKDCRVVGGETVRFVGEHHLAARPSRRR
jgi:hypothetical protein